MNLHDVAAYFFAHPALAVLVIGGSVIGALIETVYADWRRGR